MKNKLKELDVDIIGGQSPMTKEEEIKISAFIKAEKAKRKLKLRRTKKSRVERKNRETV